MAIYRPCYATRESVKRALDVKLTARADWQVDEAIQSSSEAVEGTLKRIFYPLIATRYIDWPNFQATYPWKVYLDASELADVTVNVPVLTSGGNVIPNADVFWGHPEYAPPYTYFELNRATNATFGQGNTPQRDIALTGTYGYWIQTAPAGALAAAVTDTTSTAVTVTAACTVAAGVGDNVLVDSERMLVTDKAMVSTGQTQQGTGVSTATTNDVALAVADGTQYAKNEELQLDSEQMLVVSITGNTLTVIRAWNGTALAAHSGATIYGQRSLTVQRGALGTTAATHSNAAPVNVHVTPRLVAGLTRAKSMYQLLGEQSGYTMSRSSGNAKQKPAGISLPDLEADCLQRFGRTGRSRTV